MTRLSFSKLLMCFAWQGDHIWIPDPVFVFDLFSASMFPFMTLWTFGRMYLCNPQPPCADLVWLRSMDIWKIDGPCAPNRIPVNLEYSEAAGG